MDLVWLGDLDHRRLRGRRAESTAGRLIGGVLIFLGLIFFSLITANIAAFLVRRDVETMERKEGTLRHQIKDLQAQLDRIEQSLEHLQSRETDGQRVIPIRKRP